uniref:Chitin-binding type-2 domain-containing protein n=1 Tax=Musca domestica TaxID=7370 RepID=A0A1I8M885_MUSDO
MNLILKIGGLFAVVFLISLMATDTGADCNVCNAGSNTACVSKNEYRQCNSSSKPFGKLYECNEGYFCSILGTCSDVPELAECNDCGKCDATKTFACTGTNTFSLCLGTDNTTDIGAQCSGNLVCNANDPRICVEDAATCSFRDDPTTTTTTTTTEATTTSTTTPSPKEDPAGFCAVIQQEGRFPVGTDDATTCHQYVHCLNVNGVWYGPTYNCPGKYYYDSALKSCVPKMPAHCGPKVSGLSFRSILLE